MHQKPSLRRRFFKSRAKTACLLRRFQKGHKTPGNPKHRELQLTVVWGITTFFDCAFLKSSDDLKQFYASVECLERGLDPTTVNLVVADVSRTKKRFVLMHLPS